MSALSRSALAAVWLAVLAQAIDFTLVLPLALVGQATPWLAALAALLAALAAQRAPEERAVVVAVSIACAGMLASALHAAWLQDAAGAAVLAAQRAALLGGFMLPALVAVASAPEEPASSKEPSVLAIAAVAPVLLLWLAPRLAGSEGGLAFLALTAALAGTLAAHAPTTPFAVAAVLATYCAALLAATLEANAAVGSFDLPKAQAVAHAGRMFGRELLSHLVPIAAVQAAALFSASGRRAWPAYVALAAAYAVLLVASLR